MKLLYTSYDIELPLEENHAHRLCIESPLAYAEIVQSLYEQCNGQEGGAILSDGTKPLPLSKHAEILLEPFSLKFDSGKISKKLYSEMEQLVLDECHIEYLELQGALQTFTEQISMRLPYPISYDEVVAYKDVCKLLNVHIDYGYETLAEKLCGYVTLLSQLCNVALLFLVDCEKYLTREEVQFLQETANYNKIILIYINAGLRYHAEGDLCCILDEDYCVSSNMDR